VKVPENLDHGEAVALILNYTSAYQILKRSADVNEGDTILITGASGGVGTALLNLGVVNHLKMYGTSAVQKHNILAQKGAFPIDYKSQDFVRVIQQKEPDGLDFVIDGIVGSNIYKSYSILRTGGKLVEFGYPNFFGMLKGLSLNKLLNILADKKKGELY
jgi:NADPH:quinone reductase-like Zn-dependent oxidoreductase